jgi:hypothetical protein
MAGAAKRRSSVLLVIAALTLAGCACGRVNDGLTGTDAQGLPRGPVTEDEVCARSEADLRYPGSVVIEAIRWPEVHDGGLVRSDTFATCGAKVATTDGQEQVVSWYTNELQARGWTYTTSLFWTQTYSGPVFEKSASCRERFIIAAGTPASATNVYIPHDFRVTEAIPPNARTVLAFEYEISPFDPNQKARCHEGRSPPATWTPTTR